ncbi:dephospho-CoA kinase [Desulfomarina sp.]
MLTDSVEAGENTVKIAVTGGLGSGKSTVSNLLAAGLCCELVNTDEICRQQLLPEEKGYARLLDCFGREFLAADGAIDRAKLREAVFSDNSVKDRLESILHPLVRDIVREKEKSTDCLLVEVPLLYEVGWQEDFDVCVLVYVPEAVVYERVARRDGHSREIIRSILDNQMPLDEKLSRASFIIDNSETFVSTVIQVGHLSRVILALGMR